MHEAHESRLPSTELLAAFLAVARNGSFVSAARHLGCDATVVSRRIQALERALGVTLFQRNTRRVALSEAGAVYRERIAPPLGQLLDAGHEVAGYAGGQPLGLLRVALPGAFGRMRIAPHLPAFLAAHPGIRLDASFSNRFVDLLAEGFDLALRLGVAPDTRLTVRNVGTRRRLLCAAPAYLARHPAPEVPRDLASHPCLVFTGVPYPGRWELTRDGTRETVQVSGRMLSDDAEALREAAIAGCGILFSTDWLVDDALRAGRLVPVLADWRLADEGAIHLITPRARRVPNKTRAFSEWITRLLDVGSP